MPETPRRKAPPIRVDVKEERPPVTAERVGAEEAGFSKAEFEISVGREALHEVVSDHKLAVTRVYTTLEKVNKDLKDYFPKVPQVLPVQIQGQLLNPDGTPARAVAVEAEEPVYTAGEKVAGVSWPTPRDITDDRGAFALTLPTVPVPQNGLQLRVRGSNALAEVALRRVDLVTGKLGILPLERTITPLPRNIIAQLKDIVPTTDGDVEDKPEDFADPAPAIMLGEGDCAHSFRANQGVIDRYGYSLLVRLIEPQVSPKQLVTRVREDGGNYFPVPVLSLRSSVKGSLAPKTVIDYYASLGRWRFVDRVPVDRPLDVTDFRSRLEEDPPLVPKAASLGLGYIVKMHQIWIPAGLSLGDLLYSLPLAPGEEQRVAVYEKAETLTVREAESLSIDEAQSFREAADSSTLAVFNSAYREAASGGSRMHTESDTWGIGAATGAAGVIYGVLMGGGIAGGYGSSSSSGSTSSWQQASRDFVSSASQDFHSRLSRDAAARRRSNRTGVRLATASEREQITTKVIANHNHGHALTVQYWEVLRHYAVSSRVDDVQLVCFVPLEIVQFLPTGQPRTLPTGTYTRNQLLARYAMLIRYHDVLSWHLQRRPEYQYGLTVLKNFAADPTAAVQASSGPAQDVISFSLTGTFLPFEETYVSLVTKSGARVGPIKLTGASAAAPQNTYSTTEELSEFLRSRRNSDTGETRTANLVLPPYIARTDVARFEVTRNFLPFAYKLKFDLPAGLGLVFNDVVQMRLQSNATFTPAQLEAQFGGPFVWDAKATIQGTNETYVDTFGGRAAAERMATLLPIPALRVPPILSFSDLMRIEAVFQHVVRNTVTYSKLVWMSLTPEERAILLEAYTIGVPAGGVPDASQEVPLLNCVTNEVLGYYGNAAIMPFHIPPQLAAKMGVTSRDVQEALLKFHRQAFAPPRSSITLPTRGMLGEAVLGSCNSAEKIDLTRFWNWQDSPVEKAEPPTKPPEFRGQSLIGPQGATGPTSLVPTAPVNLLSISTGQNVPAPSAGLLEQMMKQMPTPTTFADITGITALKEQMKETTTRSGEAFKESVTAAKDMAEKVIGEFPNVLKASKGIDDATKKEEEEAKKAKETAEKSALEKLASNATSFLGLAGAEADDAKALTEAKSLVSSLFGTDLPPLADLATLYEKFKIGASDDAETKRGKTAFLKVLGLLGS